MDILIRRQLVMAVVAAAVVLIAVVVVTWAVPDAGTSQTVLRVAPDGTREVAAAPSESPRGATWVAVAALVAVAGVLGVLVHHTVRVARSALHGSALGRRGMD